MESQPVHIFFIYLQMERSTFTPQLNKELKKRPPATVWPAFFLNDT